MKTTIGLAIASIRTVLESLLKDALNTKLQRDVT